MPLDKIGTQYPPLDPPLDPPPVRDIVSEAALGGMYDAGRRAGVRAATAECNQKLAVASTRRYNEGYAQGLAAGILREKARRRRRKAERRARLGL
jgi:hypothetical protein